PTDGVVLLEHGTPTTVAERRCALGRPGDVRDQDAREPAAPHARIVPRRSPFVDRERRHRVVILRSRNGWPPTRRNAPRVRQSSSSNDPFTGNPWSAWNCVTATAVVASYVPVWTASRARCSAETAPPVEPRLSVVCR